VCLKLITCVNQPPTKGGELGGRLCRWEKQKKGPLGGRREFGGKLGREKGGELGVRQERKKKRGNVTGGVRTDLSQTPASGFVKLWKTDGRRVGEKC